MTCRSLLTSLLIAVAAMACTQDDTTLTVRVQSRVNQVVGPDSSVDVSVRGGVVTLSGLASSPAAHDRALVIAQSVEGVHRVNDDMTVASTTQTTGATVSAPDASVRLFP